MEPGTGSWMVEDPTSWLVKVEDGESALFSPRDVAVLIKHHLKTFTIKSVQLLGHRAMVKKQHASCVWIIWIMPSQSAHRVTGHRHLVNLSVHGQNPKKNQAHAH